MLRRLQDHNADLQKLITEGYEVEIKGSFILVHHIPYVTSKQTVEYGSLVTNLVLNGDKIMKPSDHTIWFTGTQPCNKDGTEITSLIMSKTGRDLGNGILTKCGFSNKPTGGYSDYYQKFKRYIEIITAPALVLDPSAVVQTYRVRECEEDDVFCYKDTNSSKAGIGALNDKFMMHKVAIIGLGGTGSYILDFVSKMPVTEINLYDGDLFLQHNAFRAPGAASVEVLDKCMYKVDYYSSIYKNIRSGIVAHSEYITEENVSQLERYDFVFVSMDSSADKRMILEFLVKNEIPFVDTGIGVHVVEGAVLGQLRTSTITKATGELMERYIPMDAAEEENVYESNIQIVELNALNASFAVMAYKKLFGFYQDVRENIQTIYSINDGEVMNYDTSDNTDIC